MANALIGYTGFVGSTLLKQASFDVLYRSTNIHEIENQFFDTVICAPAHDPHPPSKTQVFSAGQPEGQNVPLGGG